MSPSKVLASLLSGILTALAFPHWSLWPLAWVGLIPLFWAIKEGSPRQGMVLGWIAGALHYGVILYWLVETMQVYGQLPLIMAVAVMVLLVLYLAGFWALFGALETLLANRLKLPLPALVPPLWVSMEILRSVLLSGFPWALLGYSQWEVTPLVQLADLTGIYGVGFLIVGANGALASLMMEMARRHRVPWSSLGGLCFWGALVAGAWLYGHARISEIEALSEKAPSITVGIAQGNLEQSIKWDPAFQEATLSRYEAQTRELVERAGAALVLWPETAVPFFFQKEGPLRDSLLELASRLRVELLFGSPAFGSVEGRRVFYNRAYLVGPDGRVLGSYDKMHLVPFGEYVPLQRLLPFVREMVTAIGDFSPGKDPRPMVSSTGARLGVSICFESIFPEISRAEAGQGADLLANLTNDAWFGQSAAPHQHLSMLSMRAVETRRWIVRAANTGISAVIDACGRVVSRTPLFETTWIVDRVPRLGVDSFYTVHGDLFAWACSLWTLGLLGVAVATGGRMLSPEWKEKLHRIREKLELFRGHL